ncbi:hypothetical protein CSUI_008623, partial [Cystoisospora suis]
RKKKKKKKEEKLAVSRRVSGCVWLWPMKNDELDGDALSN